MDVKTSSYNVLFFFVHINFYFFFWLVTIIFFYSSFSSKIQKPYQCLNQWNPLSKKILFQESNFLAQQLTEKNLILSRIYQIKKNLIKNNKIYKPKIQPNLKKRKKFWMFCNYFLFLKNIFWNFIKCLLNRDNSNFPFDG